MLLELRAPFKERAVNRRVPLQGYHMFGPKYLCVKVLVGY